MDSKHGYLIDLEDAKAATRINQSGDVFLQEGQGENRLNHWAIASEHIICCDLTRIGDDYHILVRFRRGAKNENLQLGSTQNRADAWAWVSRVNEIYEKRKNDDIERIDGFRTGPFCTQPVIHDILNFKKDIILPGDYIYSSSDGVAPRSVPAWQKYYVSQSIRRLKDYAKFRGEIQTEQRQLVPHDYGWLSDRVRYSAETLDDRITQPLELIFDRKSRHDKVGVAPLGKAMHFGLIYLNDQTPQFSLALKAQELAFSSFGQLLSAVSETTLSGKRVVICTPTSHSVYDTVKNAVAKSLIPVEQTDDRMSIGSLAEWLWKHYEVGVIACDIGVAYQIIHYLRRERSPISNQVDFALVPYEQEIRIGLCYRVDDPKWGELCSLALYDTITSKDSQVQKSLWETADLARKIGIELPLVA